MTNRMLRAVAALGAALFALAIGASPITIEFTGSVSQLPMFDPVDPFGGMIDTGTPFVGRYTYDASTPDAVADAQTGSYTDDSGSNNVAFGDPPFFATVAGGINVGIGNDFAGGSDFYTVLAPAVDAGGLVFTITLIDFDGTAFASDALPAAAPVLASFEIRDFAMRGWLDIAGAEPVQVEVMGTIDGLRCVEGCFAAPEPGSLALLAGALAWLAFGAVRARVPRRRLRRERR